MIIIKVIKEILGFIQDIYEKRYLIFELVKRDFKSRYMGSVLGLVWAVLQPLLLMFIMWFVFTYGLKTGLGVDGVPFVCYFFTGSVAWNFFAESFSGSTNVITEYSFLVKKINFRLSILPIVKLISTAIISVIFLGIVTIILAVNGFYPSLLWFQIIYYMGAMMLFSLGLSWITSALNVFIKDIGYVISLLLQFGFWVTPILWDIRMLPEKWHIYIKMNPMAYIVNGYRETFIYHKPVWDGDIFSIVYFWCFTLIVLLLGIIVFTKLRPHFADVI